MKGWSRSGRGSSALTGTSPQTLNYPGAPRHPFTEGELYCAYLTPLPFLCSRDRTTFFLKEAKKELRDAVLYYNRQRDGLGAEFNAEVHQLASSLLANHRLYRIRAGEYQRVNMHGFPYYLPYIVWNDVLHIMAIAHASREPEYWLDRPLP
ncbi:MAG: type II toxin-antitoxin system RelE/ParE family toxin [Verrucomicrobiales bacterium]|nr:type II toxin-antitoxin system RelE/ParE family toxin [Verrucomicrobiales bacterium]